MYLGSRLKELRQKANITQKELSEKTNISLRSIINYENNLREPNSRAMAALERYFGVTGDYLRGGVDRSALIVRDGQVLNGLDELDNLMYRFKDAYRATKSSNRLRATEMLESVLTRMTSSVVTNASDPDWTAEEVDRLIGVFLALNRAGRDKLLERADELQEMPRYHRE